MDFLDNVLSFFLGCFLNKCYNYDGRGNIMSSFVKEKKEVNNQLICIGNLKFSSVDSYLDMFASEEFRLVVEKEDSFYNLEQYVDFGNNTDENIMYNLIEDVRRSRISKAQNLLEFFKSNGISNIMFGMPSYIPVIDSIDTDKERIYADSSGTFGDVFEIPFDVPSLTVPNCMTSYAVDVNEGVKWIVMAPGAFSPDNYESLAVISSFYTSSFPMPYTADMRVKPVYSKTDEGYRMNELRKVLKL